MRPKQVQYCLDNVGLFLNVSILRYVDMDDGVQVRHDRTKEGSVGAYNDSVPPWRLLRPCRC